MCGFRSRFPTVTRWTTDQDLPDIVFRRCFTPVASEFAPACPAAAARRLAAPASRGAANPSGEGQAGRSRGARGSPARVVAGHPVSGGLTRPGSGACRRPAPTAAAHSASPAGRNRGRTEADARDCPATPAGAPPGMCPHQSRPPHRPRTGPGPGPGGSFLSVYSAELQLDRHRSAQSDPVRWRLTDQRRASPGVLPAGDARSWSFRAAGAAGAGPAS
jgi:hypothetical protein